jgi:23S rRNA pseudouridine2605 synthase
MIKTTRKKINEIFSLSKYLAQAGIASRRAVVALIMQGYVKVNGKVIKEPGYKLKSTDKVTYLDKPIAADKKIYILLNKPTGYITTVSDDRDRKTVLDLVRSATSARIYPVGRLDRDTSGLLVLTNDGDLAQRLAHPRHEVQKTYIVTLDRLLSKEDFEEIRKGIHLKDGFLRVDEIHFIPEQKRNRVKVIIHSGKNRIVRRIFEFFGYRVAKLDRTAYAGLTKKGLAVGDWRHLTKQELKGLMGWEKE